MHPRDPARSSFPKIEPSPLIRDLRKSASSPLQAAPHRPPEKVRSIPFPKPSPPPDRENGDSSPPPAARASRSQTDPIRSIPFFENVPLSHFEKNRDQSRSESPEPASQHPASESDPQCSGSAQSRRRKDWHNESKARSQTDASETP